MAWFETWAWPELGCFLDCCTKKVTQESRDEFSILEGPVPRDLLGQQYHKNIPDEALIGAYTVESEYACVQAGARVDSCKRPLQKCEFLKKGRHVHVIEIARIESRTEVVIRGRIEEPAGWISLFEQLDIEGFAEKQAENFAKGDYVQAVIDIDYDVVHVDIDRGVQKVAKASYGTVESICKEKRRVFVTFDRQEQSVSVRPEQILKASDAERTRKQLLEVARSLAERMEPLTMQRPEHFQAQVNDSDEPRKALPDSERNRNQLLDVARSLAARMEQLPIDTASNIEETSADQRIFLPPRLKIDVAI